MGMLSRDILPKFCPAFDFHSSGNNPEINNKMKAQLLIENFTRPAKYRRDRIATPVFGSLNKSSNRRIFEWGQRISSLMAFHTRAPKKDRPLGSLSAVSSANACPLFPGKK